MLRQWILTASVLTAAALILRLVFHKRISQRLQYALWLPVLLRLLLPFALFSAPVSVPAAAERLAPAVFAAPASRPETVLPTPYPSRPPAVSAAPIVPLGETAELRPAATPAPAEPVSSPVPARTLDWPRLLRFVWLDGSLVLALWLLGVNLGFWNKLRRSRTLFREGKTPVYVSDAVASPCLFGLFRPAVYLTPEAAELPETQLEQVLLHERTHLRQGDPIWGLLRCLCLAVWWWNPLVWLAAACSRRDGELSCDEKVLRTLGEDKRLEYGHTLVDLLPRKTPGALLCTATISGGGRDMKERLERIVKKPRLWIAAAVIAVLLTALIVGCSFAGKEETAGPKPEVTPTPAPTATELPASAWEPGTWQALYRDLVEKTLDMPYEDWENGPAQAAALLDLSGNGVPELVLYLPGAGVNQAAIVVTYEDGELHCLNQNAFGLPPSKNWVQGSAFWANPGVYDVAGNEEKSFFRYYCTEDGKDGGTAREGFYLLNSGNGDGNSQWCAWYRFGQDEEGYLIGRLILHSELRWEEGPEGRTETYCVINGQELTAEEYHLREDGFRLSMENYILRPCTEDACVVFQHAEDPLGAMDRAMEGWTPLPVTAPAAWLERYLDGEEISVTIEDFSSRERRTVSLPGDQCRSVLAACTWIPYEGPGTDHDSSAYYLTFTGTDAELLLAQGWNAAILRVKGEDPNEHSAYWGYAPMVYPDSNGSPADYLRRQVFDPAESNAATSAIRVDASEEDPALAYVLKLCEAMKNLSPGSSWGIQDYEVRGVASEEHKAQRELALHTIVYILPNEWNSVPWWAGAGMEPAAGNYEGWLIMDVYYLLELEDGAWRYKDSAQYNPGWGSLELDLDHVPEPEPTPEPTPEPEQAGTDEWLERIFGGAESLSVELTDAAGLSRTVDIRMDSCRICLRSCAWTGPYGPGADTPETEYTLTIRGGGGELVLYQGSTLGRLYLEGEETSYDILASGTYPNSNRSPADLFRRQVFDQAEYREALEAIRIDAWEENVGEAFLLELCKAEMNLFPGSTYGIRECGTLRTKQLPISGAEDTELAVGLEYVFLPNEWNCVRWWSGSGCREGEGEYEGWLIEQRYDRLVLEDGAWRWAEGATGGGWSNEIIMAMLEPEPTTEPAPEPTQESWQPVTLEMWTDWLTLPEGARWLTREELDEWTAWFNADWMRWSFLTSAYARPQDVDLGALFYTGVDLRESSTRDYSQNAVTGKDLRYYLLHRGTFEHDIDLDKLPREQMDELLRKYLGIGLEETNKIGLWFPYFPETDAYYHLHGDTNWGPFPLRYGYILGDEVCLFNLSTGNHGQFSATGYNNGGEGIYRTVLRTEGDSVRFVSNLRALTNGTDTAYDVPWQNNAYPDGYEEERDIQVITLFSEVFESREAAREYVESLGFMVTHDPDSENEYTEKAYPIEILYEETCPGFGTLVYGEIPTGTVHGSNPYLWFITADGRLYRLPLPLGGSNIRLEHDGQNSADEGRGVRLLDSRSDMLRWWTRLNGETNLYFPADAWAGGEINVQSSGSATWTLYLPTMEVFLLYEPEG